MADVDALFLGRQPILDHNQKIVAYELLFRSGEENNAQFGIPRKEGIQATATVISHVFSDLAMDEALGPYLGFINVDENLLLSDAILALPSDKIVLEILETVELTPIIIDRIRELKAANYLIALDDIIVFPEWLEQEKDLIDIIKIDIPLVDTDQLQMLAQRINAMGIKLVAEKIESVEQMRFCLELGFDYFQGYFFARPVVIKSKKLNPSEVTLIRLIGMLLDDAELNDLADLVKLDPALSLNLLRLTNSAAVGLRTRITSLRHAITILGRRQLQRWLQLLLYAATNPQSGNVVTPLMQLAASRGRLMELMAVGTFSNSPGIADRAFMVGVLSLVPTILGASMEEIFSPLLVSEDILNALITREGMMGKLLNITEAIENEEFSTIDKLFEDIPNLTRGKLNVYVTQAMAWSNQLALDNPLTK